MTETRTYHSPTREAAKAETRDRILDAVVRVVLDDGIHAFTVQNVAKKAEVSHRTVYRHFETREELLEGLGERLQTLSSRSGVPDVPESLDDLRTHVEPSFHAFGDLAKLLRAYVVTSIALQWQTGTRKRRTKTFETIIRRAFPNLPRAELREAATMIRTIGGSRGWYLLTVEGDLDSVAAGRVAGWTVRTLLDDLAKRDRAAAKAKARTGS